MTKLQLILLFALPALETAARILEMKDANTTGLDDEVASALRYAITRLQEYVAAGQPVG